MITDNYRLQFITHCNERYSYLDSVRIALEGGCRWIQLRMKEADELSLETTARLAKELCKQYCATFIIDDSVSMVQKISADGVHLGKSDMPVAEARKLLGNQSIIGGTVNTFDDVLSLYRASVIDYLGCGPYRFTSTKKNLSPILGLEGYRDIVAKMRNADICIPIVAIGGICKEDLSLIFKTGVDGVALSSSVLNAADPISEMREIVQIVDDFFSR